MASAKLPIKISHHEPKELIHGLTEQATNLFSTDLPSEVKQQLVGIIQIGNGVEQGDLTGTKEHIEAMREALAIARKHRYVAFLA